MENEKKKNTNWIWETEIKWLNSKEKFFRYQFEQSSHQHHDPLVVGNKLSELLKNCEVESVKLVTPRAVKK